MNVIRTTVGACALVGAAALGTAGLASAATPSVVGLTESAAVAQLDASGTPYVVQTKGGTGDTCTVTGATKAADRDVISGWDDDPVYETVEGKLLLDVFCS